MAPSTHDEVWEALGAWALGACDGDEAGRIAEHAAVCALCRAEADRLIAAADWIGAAHPWTPPDHLRDRVLPAMHRPPVRELAAAYARQVARLTDELARLRDAEWSIPVPRHDTVHGLVAHLAENDSRLLEALDPGMALPTGWQAQAQRLIGRIAAADATDLARDVRLAGAARVRRPARDAMVQRTFETWVHTDDVRLALGRPSHPPPAKDLRLIIEFGVRMMPLAVRGLRRVRPGKSIHLVLTGSGGGAWDVPLAPEPPLVRVAEVVVGSVDLCRLMAGRLLPHRLRYTATGDQAAVAYLLYCAATLGCDS